MDRSTKLIHEIKRLAERGFTGYLRINFSQGSLGRIEKFEEINDPVITIQGTDNVLQGGAILRGGPDEV